jgi:hypothetical protein
VHFRAGILLLVAVCGGCAVSVKEVSQSNPGEKASSDIVVEISVGTPPPPETTSTPQTALASDETEFATLLRDTSAPTADKPHRPGVWGVVSARGYPLADKVAPNGLEYTPILSLDLHTNLWLWPSQGLYGFTDAVFWGQKAAPGITNASQGIFDFSKRQFDLDGGLAWNYCGRWEARAFAYSFNNLNRGESLTAPTGYSDGVGLENRYYLSSDYDSLGTADFDVARATFISVGYYPTKHLVDNSGNPFKPGAFVRAYLTYDLMGEQCYVYSDTSLTGSRIGRPKLLDVDGGVAFRPFVDSPRWEFRLGGEYQWDFQGHDLERELYFAARFIY